MPARNHKRRRSQPRIAGVRRHPRLSCIVPEIDAMVQMDADLYNCRPSWIIADVLARYYGIDHVSPFADTRRRQEPAAAAPVIPFRRRA